MQVYIRSLDAFPSAGDTGSDQIIIGDQGGKSAAFAGSPLQKFQAIEYSFRHAIGVSAGTVRIVDEDANAENYGVYQDSGVTETDAGGNTLYIFKAVIDDPINLHATE